MSVYSILTENGTWYNLDTVEKTLTRTPVDDGAGKLAFDKEPLGYEQLLSELTIDTPLLVLWKLKDQWKVRATSPMREIVRMDVPPSPD